MSVALGQIAGAAKEGLLALSVATGLRVMAEIFEADGKLDLYAKKFEPWYRHG